MLFDYECNCGLPFFYLARGILLSAFPGEQQENLRALSLYFSLLQAISWEYQSTGVLIYWPNPDSNLSPIVKTFYPLCHLVQLIKFNDLNKSTCN